MDNKKIEQDIRKQIDEFKIIVFVDNKTSKEDATTLKAMERITINYKNKIKELCNIEIYLKGIF